MKLDSFFKDHWEEIEEDRLKRYEQMFQWRPEQEPLLAPMALAEGMKVVDFGCGPGFLTLEMARRVGKTGKAFGLDLNGRFIADATDRAKSSELQQAEFLHLQSDTIPLPDSSVDRVLCKNVLEYVPDALATLKQHYNLLVDGGMIQILDSDWGFVIVEPWGKEQVDEFFAAAAPAFKEPFIGRKLAGLLNEAGFTNIDVNISTGVDRVGAGVSVLMNMVSYIETFHSMEKSRVDGMMKEVKAAIANGNYLFALPQFVVTASK